MLVGFSTTSWNWTRFEEVQIPKNVGTTTLKILKKTTLPSHPHNWGMAQGLQPSSSWPIPPFATPTTSAWPRSPRRRQRQRPARVRRARRPGAPGRSRAGRRQGGRKPLVSWQTKLEDVTWCYNMAYVTMLRGENSNILDNLGCVDWVSWVRFRVGSLVYLVWSSGAS